LSCPGFRAGFNEEHTLSETARYSCIKRRMGLKILHEPYLSQNKPADTTNDWESIRMRRRDLKEDRLCCIGVSIYYRDEVYLIIPFYYA
jgi:hypothetical protein